MAEDYVQVPADGAGKKLRTIKDTVAGTEVHAEVVSVADPTTVTQILAVDANGKIGISSLPAIAGSVTANAGTDLNTSLLATEATLGTVHGHVDSIDGKITACNTGAVAGSVTANAGTNLNTSLLALEAGGNLATIAGKDFATQTTLATLIKQATTPNIYNVTMTNANTEYSQALPANTRKFLIHTQDESAFRCAFVTGKVAAPTAPYLSILAGSRYFEDMILSSDTIYFASDGAGKIIEIVAWT